MSDEKGERGEMEKLRAETASLEWIAAAISALLVIAALIVLVRGGLRGDSGPPRVTVEVDSIVRAGIGYSVEFRAHNAGETTAADLTVEGTVKGGEGEEKSEVTIDYLSADGTQSGGLFFTRDPRAGKLEIRPTGYRRP
jgi:uncharacterized protein (TIGR02588 family)